MTDENSRYQSFLTDIGIDKQATSNAEGIPWKLAKMGVGDADGSEPTPDPGQTELIHENYRAPLNSLTKDPVNPGTWIAELVIPLDIGGWWVRELALYDEDDEMVAIANCPPSYKPLPTQGSVRTQRVRMRFVISNSGQIELIVSDDIVYATLEYVDQKILEVLNTTVGDVKTIATEQAPSGWLKCNGEAVSRTQYANLFAAIGTRFGEGDGSTTFLLPDLRGEFVRGWDDGRGVDTERELGSLQDGQNASHAHTGTADAGGLHSHGGRTHFEGDHTHSASTTSAGAHNHGLTMGLTSLDSGNFGGGSTAYGTQYTNMAADHTHGVTVATAGEHQHTLVTDNSETHTHTITLEASGGIEARPRNVALLYVIKY
ncbi:phage tail protein [Pseudomonas gingeri]|uniref:phage tail-collar fiber domain-containing protein n=1 Tax=Pseudomonas gingeri TaxID=117681 RepID=UPI0015A291F1|nr:phage tail protein [Pseudomonas gingeri]NWD70766.1 phage tail protein [Pseudomonas gingeri]